MYTIHELEIIKAALEGDVIYQKESPKKDHPAFKNWLSDTEKLLKRVSKELIEKKVKQQILEDYQRR